MAKNAITDFSTTAASNTDVGGTDIQGSAAASNMDNAVRELMSQLADTNAGTAPWADTMTIGDAADLTKEVRFELSGITTATTRVLTVPNFDGTIATLAGTEALTNKTSINGGALSSVRNKIINGDFDVWQRATSQTSSGYGADDRWRNEHSGSTKTATQQTFTLGQTDVPGNPRYYSRTVVVSSAGAGSYVAKSQLIEGVRTLSGKTATLTFYAKADASKNMAISLSQRFGTGGSPSADVDGIEAQKVALTTSWQKFSITLTIPSISGKTLGSAVNDALWVRFWFEAGSTYDAQTDTLGQQSGTFEIARVSLVEGDATAETDPFSPRQIQQEMALCQRYYSGVKCTRQGYNGRGSAATFIERLLLPVEMRVSPTLTQSGLTETACTVTSSGATTNTFDFACSSATATSVFQGIATVAADAEL